MHDKLWAAVAAAIAAVVAAILTAVGTTYAARQKLHELRILYEQKLHETYLTNARKYIENIYLPIGIELGKLDDEYRLFRQHIDLEHEKLKPDAGDARVKFLNALDTYNKKVKELLDLGADAFLTMELEERLRAFNAFLGGSKKAKITVLEVVFTYTFSFFGSRAYGRWKRKVRGRRAYAARATEFSLSFPGIGIGFRASDVLAAPLTSRDFEERFLQDIPRIKYLIKEVTLGAHVKLSS